MKIVITGANGQLGKELTKQLHREYTVIPLAKSDLDITNKQEVEARLAQLKPEIIIHAAAYTAVDNCEINRMQAFQVNALGAGYVAKAANQINARMIYISTDYVFDGKKNAPYNEAEQPSPNSMYGLSKWLGEQLVQMIAQESTIIRTSWLYGHEGSNFVKTMLKLAKQRKEIKVVHDQIGSPTYTTDLAQVIKMLINKPTGIYQVSNTGVCSWYQFAKAIFRESGSNPNLVSATTTEEYGTLAERPAYSVMSHDALNKVGIQAPRHWEEALKDFIKKERGNNV